MSKCKVPEGLIQKESLKFGIGRESGMLYYYLERQGIYLTQEEFEACEIGEDVKVVMNYNTEKVKSVMRKPVVDVDANLPPFKVDPPSSIKLIDTNLTQLESITLKEQPVEAPFFSPADMALGGVSTFVMVMSILQTVNQKKKEAESKKCCSDTKIAYNNLEAKVSKLEADFKAKAEENSKALHAELYEQYKELKDLKEDSKEVKEILSKVIDKIK